MIRGWRSSPLTPGGPKSSPTWSAPRPTFTPRSGGVVPKLAQEAHQNAIDNAVDSALEEAGIQIADLEAVGVTIGPGLSPLPLGSACRRPRSYVRSTTFQ